MSDKKNEDAALPVTSQPTNESSQANKQPPGPENSPNLPREFVVEDIAELSDLEFFNLDDRAIFIAGSSTCADSSGSDGCKASG